MGVDWTSENVWEHVSAMLQVFEESGHLGNGDKPIIYIHNHDFNGSGGHVGKELLLTAQKNGYNYLVVDAGYRKCGTHNDNTIICDALNLDKQEVIEGHLATYNKNQQLIEKALTRFDSRESLMTPWHSDWAGGTEGSDLRQAKEYGFNAAQINYAKELASELFPLERAVTPFSEYKLRLGLAILNEKGIKGDPELGGRQSKKTVVEFLKASKQNKLKVGGDVILGLHKWETLTAKTPEVDLLLGNMQDELQAALDAEKALEAGSGFTVSEEIKNGQGSAEQRYCEIGFQAKAKALYEGDFTDYSPLLKSPWVLHAAPRTLKAGTRIKILTEEQVISGATGQPSIVNGTQEVVFDGFSRKDGAAEITANFIVNGERISVTKTDPSVVTGGAGADPLDREATATEFGMPVPGEILSFAVKEGDVLKAGQLFFTAESMKMETKITVPDELDGKKVGSILNSVKKPLKLKAPVLSFE